MENKTEQAIDLCKFKPELSKQIDDLVCSIALDCKNFSNLHEYLAVQLQAWDLIPKPATQFYKPTTMLAFGISSSFRELENLEAALKWALIGFEAGKNSMSSFYPFWVGQIYYDLNDLENAYQYFDLAFSLDRRKPFTGQYKYFQFYIHEKLNVHCGKL